MVFLLVLLFAVMFLPVFLGFRRQKRELARQSDLQQSLEIGDDVVTFSGLHGTIVDLEDETVELEIAPDVITRWTRMAIREKVAETDFDDSEYDDDDGVDEDGTDDVGIDEVGSNGVDRFDASVESVVDDSPAPSLTKTRDENTRPGN